ncbi:NnrS family protein [Idiomarina xiamenensis]|uniref:Heme/copper membrane protein n=1 Tax=Idiomarina xiamenensis 10-D-4 TaxID=740709 RepID=K2L3D7_9GAMM|nr:NnrS family protein [Idiomarina xiamenensis]EKE84390.1 heme/copper membrane protein [Idiomarina xiamenensis 10-D-4]
MNITDRQQEMRIPPILRQAFRPFFLMAGIFGVLAIALWALILSGHLSLSVYGNVLFWHSHEMIYGFVVAVVLGFLLTAVQNWTGQRATHGKSLLILALLWGAARVAMLIGGSWPGWLVVGLDLALLPTAAVLFARLVIRADQVRQLFFIPLLLLLAVSNALMHAGLLSGHYQWQTLGAYNAVLLITLLMTIIAGRVMPMFTANGTGTKRVPNKVWLDRSALGLLWLIFIIYFFNLVPSLDHRMLAALFFAAAALHALRAIRWKIWITWRVPLLWSLHLSYWFIPLGCALLGWHYLGMHSEFIHISLDISQSTAMHALTVGAMGNMILAMMARVSLGHSGRPIHPHPLMSLAFLLLIVAGLVRSLGIALLPQATLNGLMLASICWIVGYGIFVVLYSKILLTARADGNPG